jgi:hypothetical protein
MIIPPIGPHVIAMVPQLNQEGENTSETLPPPPFRTVTAR